MFWSIVEERWEEVEAKCFPHVVNETLHEKGSYLEFFSSAFSHIRTE